MYSYFSRHEVDKKGKDWNNSENPSNGKIMWLAWGGDAGYSWSRKIIEREKNKSKVKKTIIIDQDLVEEIKTILDDVVNPITEEIEIEDDVIIKSIDNEDNEDKDDDHWDEINKACWTGYVQRGMKEKNGRMVPNCVPVKKAMEADLENFIKDMKEKYQNS
jgi:hypothetical protein